LADGDGFEDLSPENWNGVKQVPVGCVILIIALIETFMKELPLLG